MIKYCLAKDMEKSSSDEFLTLKFDLHLVFHCPKSIVGTG